MGSVNKNTDPETELFEEFEVLLAHVAAGWRGLHITGQDEKALDVVNLYHAVVKMLWGWGWRGQGLLPDEELPEKYMPECYLKYWKEMHSKSHRDETQP
jgi:hypothetical protein